MIKEENYLASALALKKSMYFGDQDGVLSACDAGLASLVPWYGELLKKKQLQQEQKIKKDISVLDNFEEALTKQMSGLG